jgi:hypothetical protein
LYKVLVGKPEVKRPLGRPRCRWGDGIRMDFRESGLEGGGLDSTGSGYGPVAGYFECGDGPSGSCATELTFLDIRTGDMRFVADEMALGLNLLQLIPCSSPF